MIGPRPAGRGGSTARTALLALLAAIGTCSGCRGDSPRLSAHPLPPVEEFAFEPDVVLVATGGTNAMMELCDCPSSMTGGLSRRSGLIQSYRNAFQRVQVVDLGNALHYDPDERRNRFIPEAYAMLGYDVLLPGNHEWAQGPETLGERMTLDRPVLLATGVEVRNAPESLQLRRRLGVAIPGSEDIILLSALSGEALHFLPGQVRDRIEPTDLEKLGDLALKLRRSGKVVVVLVHGSASFARQVAREAGPVLILRGQGDQPRSHVDRAGASRIVTVGGSQVVSVVALKVKSPEQIEMDLRLETVDTRWPIDPRLLNLYRQYVAQVRGQR